MAQHPGARDAAYFDGWYADMPKSPVRDAIQQRNLGLPPHLLSTSLLPWDGIPDVAAALELDAGDTLVDLACGRGGYGLEIAHRTGAKLVGVDFSAEALRQARESASRNFASVTADFRVGDLLATGLRDDAADAVLCVDAMQFGDPYEGGLAEAVRVLAPGRPLVMTGWQARDLADDAVTPRLRHDIGSAAAAAGFVDVTVHEMPHWQERERGMWTDALAEDADEDDAALASMRREGERTMSFIPRVRRLLVTGRAPARP